MNSSPRHGRRPWRGAALRRELDGPARAKDYHADKDGGEERKLTERKWRRDWRRRDRNVDEIPTAAARTAAAGEETFPGF